MWGKIPNDRTLTLLPPGRISFNFTYSVAEVAEESTTPPLIHNIVPLLALQLEDIFQWILHDLKIEHCSQFFIYLRYEGIVLWEWHYNFVITVGFRIIFAYGDEVEGQEFRYPDSVFNLWIYIFNLTRTATLTLKLPTVNHNQTCWHHSLLLWQ